LSNTASWLLNNPSVPFPAARLQNMRKWSHKKLVSILSGEDQLSTVSCKRMRTINLVEHSERWATDFEKEVGSIKDILSENLIAAYHIGSTAISGLRAKPVIDILLEVRFLSEVDKRNKRLEELGYEAKGEYGIEGRRFFQKGGKERTHHIHVFETGNLEIERHKLFVEFMNAHPGRVAEYEKLKIELASKYKQEPDKYSEGKAVFIKDIDVEATGWKNS